MEDTGLDLNECKTATEIALYQLKIVSSISKHNHRIIEGFGSEGNPRGHLVEPTCSEQGHR